MSRAVRILLVWLVAAAIPLKGVAAIVMSGCGPDHHAGSGSVSAVAAQQSGAAHGAHEGSGHHGSHASMDHGAPVQSDAVEHSNPAPQAKVMKCSGCAPCCAPAAPAPHALQLPRVDYGSAPVALDDVPYVGVVCDVPRRPPRAIVA